MDINISGACSLCLSMKPEEHNPQVIYLLMKPNENETAIYGCHCRGDMVVHKRKVLAIPRSLYVCFSAEIGIV